MEKITITGLSHLQAECDITNTKDFKINNVKVGLMVSKSIDQTSYLCDGEYNSFGIDLLQNTFTQGLIYLIHRAEKIGQKAKSEMLREIIRELEEGLVSPVEIEKDNSSFEEIIYPKQ